ncbi:orotidine-5'-phosphate decarboxylase [bacterium]|nr:orotidine-5'-phosphate decarboxylase [bacterium]
MSDFVPGFVERILSCAERNESRLCVGLDPIPGHMPGGFPDNAGGVRAFLQRIIEATADLVCAYKPNAAFFERLGADGFGLLQELREMIPSAIPMILDAKRGDIGSTARAYAEAVFDVIRADAVTVNPLLGSDSVAPFLEYKDRGVIVLCLTSNPGADDLQIPAGLPGRIACLANTWAETNPNVGLVVGATRPEKLKEIRTLAPERLILAPGVGSQGGDLARTMRAGGGGPGLIINASRSILYAGCGSDFADAARTEADRLRKAINDAGA